MSYTKQELHSSYEEAIKSLAKAVKAGWELDSLDPGSQVGFRYALNLTREDAPPLTRAEVLAKARAEKVRKRQEQQSGGDE